MRFENRKTAASLQEELRKLAKQMKFIFMEKNHEIEAKSRELEKIRDELKLSDLEKQNLRKQVSRLKEEVTKKNNGRTLGLNLRGIKEIAALKENIRSLEVLKIPSPVVSLRRKKEMQNKIEELERKLEEFRQRNGEKATSLNVEDVLTGSLEERTSSMEDELKNLQEISLKFAEVEGSGSSS